MHTDPTRRAEESLELARRCEIHLAREEALLAAAVETLHLIRTALIRNEWSALPGLVSRQEGFAGEEPGLSLARTRLQEEAARFLGSPPEAVTFQAIARALPPDLGGPLLRTRDRLLQTAREAAAVRDANTALLGYSLDFSRRLLESLAGGGARIGTGREASASVDSSAS